jgi:hypothetical protein
MMIIIQSSNGTTHLTLYILIRFPPASLIVLEPYPLAGIYAVRICPFDRWKDLEQYLSKFARVVVLVIVMTAYHTGN